MATTLSELIKAVGDDNVELHPFQACLTKARNIKGGTRLSLTVDTQRFSANDALALSMGPRDGQTGPQSLGFVILLPYAEAMAYINAKKVTS